MRARLKDVQDSSVGKGRYTRHRRVFVFDFDKYKYDARKLRGPEMRRAVERMLQHAASGVENAEMLSAVLVGWKSYEQSGPLDEPMAVSTKTEAIGKASEHIAALAEAIANHEHYTHYRGIAGRDELKSRGLREKVTRIIVRVYSSEGHGFEYPHRPFSDVDIFEKERKRAEKQGIKSKPADLVRDYLNKHPNATNEALYKAAPGVSKASVRARKSEFKRASGEPLARTGKARAGVTSTDLVRAYIKKHPTYSNKLIYEAFPGVSKSGIRRLKAGK